MQKFKQKQKKKTSKFFHLQFILKLPTVIQNFFLLLLNIKVLTLVKLNKIKDENDGKKKNREKVLTKHKVENKICAWKKCCS